MVLYGDSGDTNVSSIPSSFLTIEYVKYTSNYLGKYQIPMIYSSYFTWIFFRQHGTYGNEIEFTE